MGFMIDVKKRGDKFVATCFTNATKAVFTAYQWESAFRMASSYAFERMKHKHLEVSNVPLCTYH